LLTLRYGLGCEDTVLAEEVIVRFRGGVGVVALLVASAAYVVAADMVESKEYKRWSACKAGSWVTVKVTVTDKEGKKTESQHTTKLAELSPEKLTLEMSEVVGGKTKELGKKEFPSKVEKKPEAPGERKEGDEEIEVAGKKMKCHWEWFKGESKGETLEVKDWFNNEIPGECAQHELKKSGPKENFTHFFVAEKWEKK
jgi:hypothetical protein